MNQPFVRQCVVAVLAVIVVIVIAFAYRMKLDDIADNHHYRKYMARYMASLAGKVREDPKDMDSRIRLADGLSQFGVYRKAGETYEEAYLLSGRAVPELKKKSDRCKFLYHFWGRDKPDPDKIDINELKRLAPSIISTNVPP
jgi:hypothetical protein